MQQLPPQPPAVAQVQGSFGGAPPPESLGAPLQPQVADVPAFVDLEKTLVRDLGAAAKAA